MTGNERKTHQIPSIMPIRPIPSRPSMTPQSEVLPLTISQLRRRVAALKRRFAPELAIIKLRRIAEAVADEWDPSEPPEPSDVIGSIAKAGFRLPTFASLGRYLNDTRRQGDVPDPGAIVLGLLPWASKDRYCELLGWDLPAPAP